MITPEERSELDSLRAQMNIASSEDMHKLVARYNVIAVRIKARGQAQRDARSAAMERAAVRSAMCHSCFTVHAGECV